MIMFKLYVAKNIKIFRKLKCIRSDKVEGCSRGGGFFAVVCRSLLWTDRKFQLQ